MARKLCVHRLLYCTTL